MNSREEATFIILGSFVVLSLFSNGVRRSLLQLLRTVLSPKILAPLLGYILWIALFVYVAARAGLWDQGLLASTILWFISVGLVWFVGLNAALKDDSFFKARAREAVGIAAFFEFFINLETLALGWEICVQVWLAFLVMLNVVAKSKAEYRAVARLVSGLILLSTLTLLINTIHGLLAERAQLNSHDLIAQLLLPVWLTIAALLALYPLAVYMAYEMLLLRARFTVQPEKPAWRGLLGAVSQLRGSLTEIDRVSGILARKIASARSFREGRRVIVDFKNERAQQTGRNDPEPPP